MRLLLLSAFLVTNMGMVGQAKFNYKEDYNSILAKSKDPDNNLHYSRLLARFTTNDTSLSDFEVLALMIGYTGKPDYRPYQDTYLERRIHDLNLKQKFQASLKLATKFLKGNPFSIKATLDKSFAFHRLEQKDSAAIYLRRVQCIFKAMHFSGEDETQDKPIFALCPADGQEYIRKFLGADIGRVGSGFDDSGNFLEILEAKFKDGNTKSLAFIIQHASTKMSE